MIQDGLNEEPLRDILRKFTYKPDWSFTIRDGMLIIKTFAPDTDDMKSIVPVSTVASIPRFVRAEFPWDRWLLDQIMSVEDHEAREFFKIDGVKVFDPHA